VLRPVSLLPALVAALSTLAWVLAPTALPSADAATPASRHATPRADDTPLGVAIDSLAPSTLPDRGPVRVTGSVTNRDTEAWTAIRVYAFVSTSPITSEAELAEAPDVPADADVGGRITDTGTSDTIDRLEPGETLQFSLTVPHRYLAVTEAGVYWFGVHALGEGPDGRVPGADGRARTFMPYIPRSTAARRTVDTALVVPVRRLITHTADGRVAGPSSWTASLSPGGDLRSLVDLGVASGARPITWLVDPAVLDAAGRLAAGNPPRSMAPTVDQQSGGGGGESPSPDATPSPSDNASEAPGPDLAPGAAATAAAATAWLDRLHEGLTASQVLALPYGDVDVAGAAAHDPAAYRAARRRSDGDLQPWGLPTTPAVSSPTGYLDRAGIRLADPTDTLLVTDRMFGENAPSVVNTAGRTLAVASSGAASGGPGPDEPLSVLAVRQRLVSEAALRLLSPGRKPLIVVFPSTWTPDPVTGFFEGLDVDWLRLTSLAEATQGRGIDVPLDRIDYPESQRLLTLGPESFAAADELARSGDVLQNLLVQNDRIGTEVRDEAMSDTSYSTRARPGAARASAGRSRGWIEGQLRSVHIDAPRAVVLASGSGKFAATVTNNLDQPVAVRIQALPDPPLRVAVPRDSIALGPQSRTTVLLNASSSAVGVRNVTLVLTDTQDVPLGSSDDVPIRSNRVSNVIWLIIGTGVALLMGAIGVRLFRRIRAARS
jgi:hypothetical protein